MSNDGCDQRNLLLRSGVTHAGRRLAALNPRSVRIDDRSLADLLLYTGRCAEQLQYWSLSGVPEGNFSEFVRSDPSFAIAEIAASNDEPLRIAWLRARDVIETHTLAEIEASHALTLPFHLIFNLALRFEHWRRTLVPGSKARSALQRQLEGALRTPLALALQLARWCEQELSLDFTQAPSQALAGGAPEALPGWSSARLSSHWLAGATGDARLGELLAGAASTAVDGADARARARGVLARLTPAWEAFLRVSAQLRREADGWFQESVLASADHAPQMALWFAFARLFRYAQADLNQLVTAHLDFYLERVLALAPRAAIPDQAFVSFALARHVQREGLPAGTLLRAGRDAAGNERTFALRDELSVNRAKLLLPTDLKVIGFDVDRRPFAAAVAASRDGRGAAFEDDTEHRWWPFGSGQRAADGGFLPADQRSMSFAELGLAVRSPLLFLREGTRTIALSFKLAEPLPTTFAVTPSQLRVRLTSTKGWYERALTSEDAVEPGEDREQLLITLALSVGDPPITAHRAKVHGPGHDDTYPVLELRLANDETLGTTAHLALGGVRVTACELEVRVEGVKTLTLQSELGLLDPTRSFQPFGPSPLPGARFYIGSDEALRKPLESLDVNAAWQQLPADLASHYAAYPEDPRGVELEPALLWNRSFQSTAALRVFAGATNLALSGLQFAQEGDLRARWSEPAPTLFDHDTSEGFLRLTLKSEQSDPFGHRRYPSLFAQALVDKSAVPNPPWTPMLRDLTLSYTSRVTLTLDGIGDNALLHVFPFGVRAAQGEGTGISLVPTFMHDTDTGRVSDGELYVGLSGLAPRESVSLLVQVADGSADPELTPPDVRWWYWRGTSWQRLPGSALLLDETRGFLGSGRVILDVPSDAALDPGLLEAGRHWLRVSIAGEPRGACAVLDVRTQAGLAERTLGGQAAAEAELRAALPAGTIDRLADPRSTIQRTEQPYASFAGAPAEQARDFRTRVSERLRHKNRAVALWDYERLALQAFPSLYRVKAINHTTYGYARTDGSLLSSEFAPGWVTLVVVPDLRNRNAVDRFAPRVSVAMLEQIREHLTQRCGSWVKLRVVNPLYERVSVHCKVAFGAGQDVALRRHQLSEELKQFLCPWAFEAERTVDLHFGGSLHRSALLSFVESRLYVDHVTDFVMTHQVGDGAARDVERAEPASARSIFVSTTDHELGEATC
jgi:hypothetical protein